MREIRFTEIRGVLPEPVFLERGSSSLSLDSPVFLSFGGRVAIEKALRLAATGPDAASVSARGWMASLAMELYRLALGWRLSRRERILLRHVPEEVLASRNDVAARLLLRMLRARPDAD
jgi:hypothetical protein